MLRVNIFFMLFEKLLYVTKELLLMLLIFSSALACIKLSLSLTLSFDISALQKLIYSMDQLTKISIEICWGMAMGTLFRMKFYSCNMGLRSNLMMMMAPETRDFLVKDTPLRN